MNKKVCPTCQGEGVRWFQDAGTLSNSERPHVCPTCEGARYVIPAGPPVVSVDAHGNVDTHDFVAGEKLRAGDLVVMDELSRKVYKWKAPHYPAGVVAQDTPEGEAPIIVSRSFGVWTMPGGPLLIE